MFNSQTPVRGILGAGNGITNKAWRIKPNGEKTFRTGGQYQFEPKDVYLGISQGGNKASYCDFYCKNNSEVQFFVGWLIQKLIIES